MVNEAAFVVVVFPEKKLFSFSLLLYFCIVPKHIKLLSYILLDVYTWLIIVVLWQSVCIVWGHTSVGGCVAI